MSEASISPSTQSLHGIWKNGISPERSLPSAHDACMATLGASMALIVFLIDTFTPIESAIAVLYVLSLMVLSDALTRAGILGAAGICFILCVASYFLQHGTQGDYSTIGRLIVSLAAITLTAGLLLKNEGARREIIRSHAETARSEYRYRSIFDGARVAIFEQDYSALHSYLQSLRRDGVTDLTRLAVRNDRFPRECAALVQTVAANEAAVEMLHAASEADLLGALDRFIPDREYRFFDVVETLFEGRRDFMARGTIRAIDGTTKWVLTVLKFPDDSEALKRVVVALVDITEREQTHAALLAAQTELARATRVSTVGVVSASIAHELHQPIGTLTVNAETCLRWMDRDPPNIEAARKAVERMISDAERASHILKTTRSMVSREPAPAEPVEIVGLIRETAELLEYALRRDGITLTVSTTENAVHVATARNEFQQVVINLITNAAQAIAETANEARRIQVLITSTEAYSTARIEVTDTGPGIDADHLNKVFDPFYTTKHDGMGMGLAISRSAIEAHGGRLTAVNNACGPGARFVIELPQKSMASSTAPALASAEVKT